MASENTRSHVFGAFRLQGADRRLFHDGVEVPIAPKAFDLLQVLVENPGRLLSREELIQALWPRTIVTEHNLTSTLYQLRKALGDEGSPPRYIETARGHGYRFIASVSLIDAGGRPVPDGSRPTARYEHPARRLRRAALAAAVVVVVVGAAIFLWRWNSAAKSGDDRTATPVIAVLPFTNLSADKANAYLTQGIQDTILTRLAAISGLRVISHTSTESYASRPENLKTVARQLGASEILEGSVQKAGDRVQVNVQLIDARTDTHLWAKTYDRDLENLFGVEGEVAANVTQALQTKLLPTETASLSRPPTRDAQAYLLYLKANHYTDEAFYRTNAKDPASTVAKATALYQQAIARDPRFALAYARLSLLDAFAYWFEIDPSQIRAAAAELAAKRALALDPALPPARFAMGYVEYYCHRNYPAALRQFNLASLGLPHNAAVTGAIAFIHRRQGKWDEALDGLAKAAAFDPRNPSWFTEMGNILMALRRYPEAVEKFDQALAIAPDSYDAAGDRVAAWFMAGKLAQASKALAQIPPGVDPQGLASMLRFQIAWLARAPDRALAALATGPTQMAGPETLITVPKSLLEARVWTLKGDPGKARPLYQDARDKLLAELHRRPESPDLWSAEGLAAAGLGEKAAAIRAGRRAVKLFPPSKDAMAGPVYLTNLAEIYAISGEAKPVVPLLRRLLAMPAGASVSIPVLRMNPIWDPVRKDPGFQALLRRRGGAAPAVPASVAVAIGTGVKR
ncbi:MAG TPA: winged helix-turn-helix domain-containing protein [Gammaproteobacteria bacterium]|nr:winged helix-turn-helix domain-containing protein [Gammaproteobacteria bacterium]